MFVEITRLFIVLLATAAGFALGRGEGPEPGNGAVIGAILGALVGYVAGGLLGRLLRSAMRSVEAEVEKAPPAQLLVGTVGAAAGGVLTTLLAFPAVMVLPTPWGWPVLGLLVWIGVFSGYAIAGRKSEELLALVGLSTRPLARMSPYNQLEGSGAMLADTSAIIDGRLLGIARAGFLRGELLVPRFVLDELQTLGDAQDESRRRRGHHGLETLAALRHQPGTTVHTLDDEVPEFFNTDAKLIELAHRLRVPLVTIDAGLQRVAETQGVICMNLHKLAESVRQTHVPGEAISVRISKEGSEAGQGVAYLDDGTMVVVTDGAQAIGQQISVRVTGMTQTPIGRMLFASLDGLANGPAAGER